MTQGPTVQYTLAHNTSCQGPTGRRRGRTPEVSPSRLPAASLPRVPARLLPVAAPPWWCCAYAVLPPVPFGLLRAAPAGYPPRAQHACNRPNATAGGCLLQLGGRARAWLWAALRLLRWRRLCCGRRSIGLGGWGLRLGGMARNGNQQARVRQIGKRPANLSPRPRPNNLPSVTIPRVPLPLPLPKIT